MIVDDELYVNGQAKKGKQVRHWWWAAARPRLAKVVKRNKNLFLAFQAQVEIPRHDEQTAALTVGDLKVGQYRSMSNGQTAAPHFEGASHRLSGAFRALKLLGLDCCGVRNSDILICETSP